MELNPVTVLAYTLLVSKYRAKMEKSEYRYKTFTRIKHERLRH